MQDLPLHPGSPVGTSGARGRRVELTRRLERLQGFRREQPSAVQTAWDRRMIEAVYETLRLTGHPCELAEIERSAGNLEGGGGGDPEIRAQFHALRGILEHASAHKPLDLRLIVDTHRRSSPELPAGFRQVEVPPQFKVARRSPPEQIGERLQNLLGWLYGESGGDMGPAEAAALFFARFLEIAPFERRNFRTAHLLVNAFPLAAGFPPICLERDAAEEVRREVNQAMEFDTAALVARFEMAIDASMSECERLLGLV